MCKENPDYIRVIRCKDCGHCFELNSNYPTTPYCGGKAGYYCDAWDADFYAPYCDPNTYYCADAIPRKVERYAGEYADKDTLQNILRPAT